MCVCMSGDRMDTRGDYPTTMKVAMRHIFDIFYKSHVHVLYLRFLCTDSSSTEPLGCSLVPME